MIDNRRSTLVLAGRISSDRMLKMVAAMIAMTAIALALGAGRASASFGYFCPPNSETTIALNAYPGRCVHAFHNHIFIVNFTNFVTPVSKCAVVKPNADGSGGNVNGKIDCEPEKVIATVAFPEPGVSGYATGINNSSNYHTGFKGFLTLY